MSFRSFFSFFTHDYYLIILNLMSGSIAIHLQSQEIQIYSQVAFILMFAKVYRKGYLNHICTNTQEGKQWLGTHVYLYAVNVLEGLFRLMHSGL